MDHFENIVRLVLEREGYWVLSAFKVNLTKEEKAATGKPTIPRPEIDLIAYRPRDNEVLAVEVKSFFDSTGVQFKELTEIHDVMEGRYKLFTSSRYRGIVFSRLAEDLVKQGFLKDVVPVRLALAAGNIKNGDTEKISDYMTAKGWKFWSPQDIKAALLDLTETGYENDAAYIVTKILMR